MNADHIYVDDLIDYDHTRSVIDRKKAHDYYAKTLKIVSFTARAKQKPKPTDTKAAEPKPTKTPRTKRPRKRAETEAAKTQEPLKEQPN